MKLITLFENDACQTGLCFGHGLSLYLEVAGKKILFDMGADEGFLDNAKAMGIDLSAVDLAMTSHAHDDHTGGLETFLQYNHRAKVYLRESIFTPLYRVGDDIEGGIKTIGIDPALKAYQDRFVMVGGTLSLGQGLTLFGDVEDLTGETVASATLKELLPDGTIGTDRFTHEQNLLIEEDGKTILIAGCAHSGIINILNKAEVIMGKPMDVVVGGFHLFQLTDSNADGVIDALGEHLKSRPTQYYTGHCTGDYAYNRLAQQLGDQLHRIRGGYRVSV